MAILTFSLGPESISRLHDALACLGKFSDSVSFDASPEQLVLNALNSSKSAYASFTLERSKFFLKYQYKPPRGIDGQLKEKSTWKILNKALLSVFKGRVVDSSGEKETAVERCDISVEDGDGTARSRFIIKIICRHGVLKTYKLQFEEITPVHALFVKENANNRWAISSKTLREFVEHFGPGTEQLDIYSEDGRVSFTSYTEKIMSGNEILKQPLHTTIAIDTLEFGEFSVEEKLHIIISVKDFKSIVLHAGLTNTMVKTRYSVPCKPLQLMYSEQGMTTEFILMTIGDYRSTSSTPAVATITTTGRAQSHLTNKRPASRQPLGSSSESKRVNTSGMPPPPLMSRASTVASGRGISSRKDSRPSPPPPQQSIHSQALFHPEEDEDKRWDPMNYEDDPDEMLLWDTGEIKAPITVNSSTHLGTSNKIAASSVRPRTGFETEESLTVPTQRLSPTQKLSEVRGIFD